MKRMRKGVTVFAETLPVFLNSTEEIGWKAPPQNRNLKQEVA
jgi:hypothetical protein